MLISFSIASLASQLTTNPPKNNPQPWNQVIEQGWPAIQYRVQDAWNRKGALIYSDVDDWHHLAYISALSNMTTGILRASDLDTTVQLEWDYNYKQNFDIEATYSRHLSHLLQIYSGIELKHKNSDIEHTALLGVRYVLPLLVDSELRINSRGRLRLQLGSEYQLLERLNFEWYLNTDREYRLTLNYELNKMFLISANYDSTDQLGVGIRVRI